MAHHPARREKDTERLFPLQRTIRYNDHLPFQNQGAFPILEGV